jgi:hypothetical protein
MTEAFNELMSTFTLWKPSVLLWADVFWAVIVLMTVGLLSCPHSTIDLLSPSEQMFLIMLTLISLNKVFFTATIFGILFAKENHPKHMQEIYNWRIGYDLCTIVVSIVLSHICEINPKVVGLILGSMVGLEVGLYLLPVRAARSRLTQI